ncbi:MAG: archaeal proteasome endopeptidase complex subunit beta [Candidatus Norongarragalinales archaeon]
MTETEKKFLRGTTTVGVTFNGGVVLAADKRAVMESFIAAKEVEKIHLIGDKIALTLAGGVGDAQSLVRIMRAEIELYKYSRGREITVEGAATLLANILQGSKYFPYLVQLVVAGFDDKPRLFDLDPLGGLLPERYVATGSGSITAYGLLDENYRDTLSESEAVRLAAKAVAAAMKRDNATGEGIDVVVITRSGARRVPKNEVQAAVS